MTNGRKRQPCYGRGVHGCTGRIIDVEKALPRDGFIVLLHEFWPRVVFRPRKIVF